MTIVAIFLAIILAALLCLVTLIQLLYMESLRIRARDLPSLQFFKETLEDRIGAKSNQGALVFSLVKHTSLLLLGLVFLSMRFGDPTPVWAIFLQVALLSWLAMLLLTYVIPQTLYRKTSGEWLLPLTPLLRGLVAVIKPVTWVLGFFQSLVELAQADEPREEPPHSAEHIEALITAGAEEGILEEEDRKLIQSVVAFGDKTVREVMTSRPNIVGIAADRSLEDLREMVIHEQYSRIPVYERNVDDIIGFVHVRDMFELDTLERGQRAVRELARPIRHIPETKHVNDLLREMQDGGAHMAIVVDEYGNTAGLVTMEDMVEEILGEIRDEHEPTRDITEEGEGNYIVSGSFDLDRLHDLLNFRPQEETESTTVGGLVTEWLGHVPHVGETVEREGIHIQVLAGNDLRVEQVKVSRAGKKASV
ncbi:MAG: hemolysin family protein [Bryobacteraceae bacterium]